MYAARPSSRRASTARARSSGTICSSSADRRSHSPVGRARCCRRPHALRFCVWFQTTSPRYKGTPQQFVNRRRRPARWTALLRTRRRRTVVVQSFRDRADASAGRTKREDLAHDSRLGVVDTALNMRAPTIWPEDRHVVVPEHTPTGDFAPLRFPPHRIVRALARLLAFEFVGERGQREQDLVGRGIEGSLPVLKVEEHTDPGGYELLQRICGFNRFTTEARFIG